jgi:hypothetical protein
LQTNLDEANKSDYAIIAGNLNAIVGKTPVEMKWELKENML